MECRGEVDQTGLNSRDAAPWRERVKEEAMGFSFHANTLAFGGQIEEPGVRTKYLPSEASVILPPGGGIGEAVSGPYSKEGISFESARSYVTGSSFGEQVYNTYANVTVTDL